MAAVLKRALIIGINYVDTPGRLAGCVADANNIKAMLTTRGYLETNIVMMTDEPSTHADLVPIRKNILREFLNLVVSGVPQLYFHYSGHGSSVKDTDGDEGPDGTDETLVPLDFFQTGAMIVDDELKGVLKCLDESQTLFCTLDCCHSGTGIDLRYNVFERAGKQFALVEDKLESATRGMCVCISGCQDNQTSADAFEEGKSQGAMSYGFLKALKDPKVKTYEDLIYSIRTLLRQKGYSQVPSMSFGKPLNLKTQFSF